MAKEIKFNVKLLVDGKEQLVAATTNVKELSAAFEESRKNLKRMNEVLVNANQKIELFKNSVEAVSQLSAALKGLTAESEGFEAAMRSANTLAQKDEAGFGKMKEQVAELSKSIPIARDALANGLYQVISSDLPEDNWMQMLEVSTKAAIGGQADLSKVVSATATVIKNYGLAWEEAGALQDKIQATAKVGETTFEEMAASLPKVASSAATLGVSIDELMGMFATLTGVSGDTAEVATQLSAVLNALIKPTSSASKMAEEMGIKFDAAAIKAAGGFQNFLTQLDASIKGYSAATGTLSEEVYGKLFKNAEALRALIPLTGELKDKYSENVAEMADVSGTLDAAVEQMSQTTEAKTQLMRNQWAWLTDAIHEAIGD